MKVLLCSPYKAGLEYEQGGIVVWANNMMSYYSTQSSDDIVDVVPFNRKVRKGDSLFSRIWGGIVDYRTSIKETVKQLENGYDVLHLCTSAQLSLTKDYIVLKKARRKGAKTVVHLHFGRVSELVKKRNWEWKLLKNVIKLADAVVTMDMKSYQALRDSGYNHIYYLPNPLSQEIMQQIAEEASSVSRIDRKLCFVGHVIPTKGVYEMIQACKQIDNIKLHVIGKVAPEVRSLMEEVAGKSGWLVFVGEVSHQEVIREMLSSGIFVLPSYTEGFPNVILESMACGCAIVATNVGAIPEMLDIKGNEPCGLCSVPKDVDSLCHNIESLLEAPSQAYLFSERAKKRVNEMYAIPKVWNQLIDIWSNVHKMGLTL